jgi:hypothetical protein
MYLGGTGALELDYKRFVVNSYAVAYRPLSTLATIAQGVLENLAADVGTDVDTIRARATALRG